MKRFQFAITAVAAIIALSGMSHGQQIINGQMIDEYPAGQRSSVQPSYGNNQTIGGTYVQPGFVPPSQISPPFQNPFYFGMDLQAAQDYSGFALRVANVTPGSPSQIAGLEPGDVIVSVNGQRLRPTNDSFAAVRELNQIVLRSSQPAPASPSAPVGAYVAPIQNTAATANFTVRNVRNGQLVQVIVYPTRVVHSLFPSPITPASPAFAR